jgi:hypothetical protein
MLEIETLRSKNFGLAQSVSARVSVQRSQPATGVGVLESAAAASCNGFIDICLPDGPS